MFGVQWVMPRRVIDLFTRGQGRLGQLLNSAIWRAIPHCLMWCIWRKHNAWTFERCEQSALELKLQSFIALCLIGCPQQDCFLSLICLNFWILVFFSLICILSPSIHLVYLVFFLQ